MSIFRARKDWTPRSRDGTKESAKKEQMKFLRENFVPSRFRGSPSGGLGQVAMGTLRLFWVGRERSCSSDKVSQKPGWKKQKSVASIHPKEVPSPMGFCACFGRTRA